MISYLRLILSRHAATSLTQRFARATAALVTTVLLLTVAASWWLAKAQNDAADRFLLQKEADYSAVLAGSTIRGVASRIAEMADGSLLSSALTDSAGKENYLHPYLTNIHQINGIPVSILFTDFIGHEMASNNYSAFTDRDHAWLLSQLASGKEAAIIQSGENGPELLAIELISPPRTGQPEGALLYKFSIDQILYARQLEIGWRGKKSSLSQQKARITAPIDLPPPFQDLGFTVMMQPAPSSFTLDPAQLALIVLLPLSMALIILLLGRRLGLSLTLQLRQLEAFSSEVVRNGFGRVRATVEGSDEVASLAGSINHMLDTLHLQHDRLTEQSERRNQLLARYRLLVESTNAISWEAMMPECRYTFVSPQAERIFGFSISEWQTEHFWDMHVHVDDLEHIRRARESAGSGAMQYRCEYRLRHKNGHYLWVEEIGAAVRSPDKALSTLRGILLDVGQRKAAETEIQQLAFYDPLTGLPNRRMLLDRLRAMVESSSGTGLHGAVLYIDLDNFKTINDTLGHEIGDMLLQQAAERLTSSVRKNDVVARLGGDEFVVILQSAHEPLAQFRNNVHIVAEKILATMNKPYQMQGHEHHSSASIGVYLFDPVQNTVTEMLQRADLAMYQAKSGGRNSVRFFEPGMQSVMSRRAGMEVDLRRALRDREFRLHYQPQVTGEGTLLGFESLLRWQHPERGQIAPAEFIGLAEDTGLIMPIGMWVLEQACLKLVEWATQPETARLMLSVNVSVQQFRHDDFVEQILAVIKETGVDPRLLKLELTESLLVEDVDGTIQKMKQLKRTGLLFSLDDFGTGYSSLSYLRRLPLDELKIDNSFLRNLLTEETDAAIVRTIVVLAQSLGLSLMAEGVEDIRQMEFLTAHGCHAFQGYLFGRAMDEDHLRKYLVEKLMQKV